MGCGLVGNLSGLLLHQFPAKGAGEDAFFKAIKEGKGESRLSVGSKGGVALRSYLCGDALLCCKVWHWQAQCLEVTPGDAVLASGRFYVICKLMTGHERASCHLNKLRNRCGGI